MKSFRQFLKEATEESVFLSSVILDLGNNTESLVALGVFSSQSIATSKAKEYIQTNLKGSEENEKYEYKVGRIHTRLEPDQDSIFVKGQFVTLVAYQENGSAILKGIKIFPDSRDAKNAFDELDENNRIAFKVKYDDSMREVGIATVKKF